MVGYDKESRTYFCSVCGLHYLTKELAEECEGWCSTHNSCNLLIARNSIEARKSEKR